MSGAHLAHPDWVPALVAGCLLFAIAIALAGRRTAGRSERLLGERTRALAASDLALLATLFSVAFAFAGPRCGESVQRVPATGADVVLLLDVSRSMLARDVAPSRLDRAREAARRLLGDLAAGDRAALAAFAGRGVLLTPLTTDKDALAEMLPALDDELLAEGGSRLRLGIEAALPVFARSEARPRVVVVFSDGENPQRGEKVAARPLLDARVRVVAALFGSEQGATIPDQGGVVTDADGHVVTSRRDPSALAALTSATDGALLLADRWGEVDGGALADAVRRDADRTGTGFIERRVPTSRTAPLAALALALLLAEAAGLDVRFWLRGRARAVGAYALLSLLWMGAGPLEDAEVQVKAHVDDALALIELGVARAEAGDVEEAQRAFLDAALRARDRAGAALAYYDLGVIALQLEDLEAARDAFLDALALAPKDLEARFNLEWTLAALAQPPMLPMPGAPSETAPREAPGQQQGAGENAGQTGSETGESREGRSAGSTQSAQESSGTEGEANAEAGAERDERGAEGSGSAEGGEHGAPEPARLGPEEAARWLEAVRDDPGRALASAARAATPGRTPARPDAPTW